MNEVRNANAPQPIRLADYAPPDYLIDRAELAFALDPKRTIVRSRLVLRRRPGAAPAPLVLNGEAIELLSLSLDGQTLPAGAFARDDKTLTIAAPPEHFTLDIETACAPDANTALSGLYLSNGMFCTQCEAEGFRRITYFLDRPDVLARYRVRIEADRRTAPVLLSNGNPVETGGLPGGRHFAVWDDPFPKPAYLFALVGGDLAAVEDSFTTRSGRNVALKIFVQKQNAGKCGYTLDSLKRAMRWDEDAFGREYDLDIFMIVAVDHFNFGAMENKGLNIFNAAYVLASPETATDADYEAIESIVAHEYFHNWSGNRVTCRDWFQLCLKEGFTVFRDQEFSSDMRSRAVQRIKDVRQLWSIQFPEDAGPLAHPVRPESYLTIDNFYTATVYEKGAELCRMLKTLLGPEQFRAACDLYFERHDGSAATVEDFVRAMEDASGRDLQQFRRWYSDAGAPDVAARESYDESAGAFTLELAQATQPTPGQDDKPARHIPIDYALYGAKSGRRLEEGRLDLTLPMQIHRFGPYKERPIASLLRGYSAPVTLRRFMPLEDRLTLAAHEEDLFNRWAATDSLWRDLALAAGGVKPMREFETALVRFAEALAASLKAESRDPALAAELLRCPPDSDLVRSGEDIDPDRVTAGRRDLRARVAALLKPALFSTFDSLRSNAPFDPGAVQAGERALKNAALSLLVASGERGLALEQARTAANMTDEAAATAALAQAGGPEADAALQRFYDRWKSDNLVVNKWLAMQASSPGGVDRVTALLSHEAYDPKNPNRVRSLLGAFARDNIGAFHQRDGAGYQLLADQILSTDRLNPQLAARLTTAFEYWRKLEPVRRRAAESALRRLAETKGISTNLFEMTSRLVEAA